MSRLSTEERKRRDEILAEGLLWCVECKQSLPVSKFNKWNRKRSNYGHRYYCRVCEYAIRDKRKTKLYFKQRNTALKAKSIELTGGCCQKCGYDEYLSALEFHHVYPSQKKDDLATIINNGNAEETRKELDKCCLLCSNCHRGFTGKEWGPVFVRRGNELVGYTIGVIK